MHTTVKFAKVRPTAKIPTKRVEDAGYDIYADFEEPFILINPHETVMIPTGIASACDTDYCFVLKERGSTGTKGMAQRSGIIDSGFRSEWFVPITNTTDNYIMIAKSDDTSTDVFGSIPTKKIIRYPYEKAICQALIIPVPTVDVEEYTYEELLAIASSRGMGALGSSGKSMKIHKEDNKMYKPKVITPKQLSECLGCSINTAYDLCRRRDFPSFKVGRKILILEDELHTWMLKQTTKT